MRGYNIWLALLLSIILIGYSLEKIITGTGGLAWGKFPYPAWASWVQLIGGLCIGFMVIRALLRGEGKPRPYTDEDVEKSKRILEQMHMREHGTPPEYPGDDGRKR